MTVQMNIEDAQYLCKEAHKGQFRRAIGIESDDVADYVEKGYIVEHNVFQYFWAKLPYHTHPFAVADMMDTDDEKIVAYLHDVIEDTEAKLLALDGGYHIYFNYKHYPITKNVYIALQAITKGDGESVEDYLQRVSENKLATKVKIADMFHNMSSNPTEKARKKYLTGIKILLKEL